jgi:hypothetical protein
MVMMIILVAVFAICMCATVITGYMIDTNRNSEPPIVLIFFFSIVIGFSAITSFIIGHFVGF